MKLRRSDRMVVISNYLINNPYKLTSLNTFAEKYESAKSSISEDIVIIKRAFEEIEIGHIQTVTGAGGGVIFTPSISSHEAKEMIADLRDKLSESDRILPGGYIYLSDLLSTPAILKNIGRIIAKSFMDQKIDAVMTVATKGVPLANAVANVLNVPFVIVRLIILPLGIYQSWKATLHSEKMNALKHVLEPHQTRLKEATTQEEKLEAQQALFAAQKEHGISMLGGVGCFPILIQMPFFSAIYFAAQHTEGVADSNFLGIALGSPSMLLVAFAGVLYYLQSILSLHGVEDEMQREQLKKMIYMSPLMIVIFSLFSPASVTLYWVVGGFMMILQQFIVNYVVRPKLRQKVREEYEKNPPKVSPSSGARKDVTPKQPQAITTNKKKKNRNSGKQRSR